MLWLRGRQGTRRACGSTDSPRTVEISAHVGEFVSGGSGRQAGAGGAVGFGAEVLAPFAGGQIAGELGARRGAQVFRTHIPDAHGTVVAACRQRAPIRTERHAK